MSGVHFTELLLIFVIGLLILGPERLPKVAAQIGRWVGRARRTANQLRIQLEREIALDDIKRAQEKKPRPDPAPTPPPGDAAAASAGPNTAEAGGAESTDAASDSASDSTPESAVTQTTAAVPGDPGSGADRPSPAPREGIAPRSTESEPADDETTVR